MATEKVRLQPHVSKEVAAKLEALAEENGHKVGPYAAHILTKHVEKQEIDKPFTSKKEYK